MGGPVILFSVDGMRPDALSQACTPVMDRLVEEGASTMAARTVMPSVTLPCHTSMLRGVDVPRHGITTNLFAPLARPVLSLIDVASQQGKRCAMFYNWGPLRDLCGPESLEFSYFFNGCHLKEGDERVAAVAADHLARGEVDFAFVYLGFVDMAGHDKGWMSDHYLRAIESADRCIGCVLGACPNATVLVQSDHGGHERTHGTDSDEDMLIPWILAGPGVGHCSISEEVRIFDTCPTLAHAMGLRPAKEWEGKVVSAAV